MKMRSMQGFHAVTGKAADSRIDKNINHGMAMQTMQNERIKIEVQAVSEQDHISKMRKK